MLQLTAEFDLEGTTVTVKKNMLRYYKLNELLFTKKKILHA